MKNAWGIAKNAASFRPLSRYIGLYRCLTEDYSKYPNSFRPLSRYIGLYLNMAFYTYYDQLFPSPLEVYRFISNSAIDTIKTLKGRFPSPLEVYRFISPYLVS